MPFYTDQMNRQVLLMHPPTRIVSLVPSQTELLFDLGLLEEVVGITKFCVHPQHWFREKQRVGGTKTIHLEKIKELRPDLIIANKEENVREQIEALSQHYPVWVSDVNTVDDAYNMIKNLGTITGKKQRATELIDSIQQSFNRLLSSNIPSAKHKRKVAYLIWKDPYMTVGGDTFINDMLAKSGLENVFADQKRYPIVTIETLQASNCEVVLLSSEPYPFQQKHLNELAAQLPAAKCLLVDGEMFSWYGSRLLRSAPYLTELREKIDSIL